MKAYTPESEEVTLVVLGSFNPAIYQPEWFIRKNFVAQEELEGDALNLGVIHKEMTQFENAWFLIEVNPSRFMLRAKQASRIDSMRDLACNVFSTLAETPISSFGINLVETFRCSDLESWHKIGDTFVPKNLWESVTGQTKRQMGMKEVEVRVERDDGKIGNYNIKIAPSSKNPPKFMVHFNDHYEYESMDLTADEFSAYLLEVWSDSLSRQKGIIQNLVKGVEES